MFLHKSAKMICQSECYAFLGGQFDMPFFSFAKFEKIWFWWKNLDTSVSALFCFTSSRAVCKLLAKGKDVASRACCKLLVKEKSVASSACCQMFVKVKSVALRACSMLQVACERKKHSIKSTLSVVVKVKSVLSSACCKLPVKVKNVASRARVASCLWKSRA